MSAEFQQPQDNKLIVRRFKGLNERLKYVNPDAAEQDNLRGWIQQTTGVFERANGTSLLQRLSGKILNIHQTFDNRENVIVQTDQGIYIFSEDQLFNRASTAVLTPVTLTEEDTMAEALLVHSQPSGANGGALAASTWTIAPISSIVHQKNADGTNATFVTALAGNVWTLAAGVYRIEYESVGGDNSGTTTLSARLYNVTAGAPAWNGAQNKQATSIRLNGPGTVILKGRGFLDASGGPVQLRLEQWASQVTDTTGMGAAASTGDPEVYRWVRILKTA